MNDQRARALATALDALQGRLRAAAAAVGRNSDDIELLPVTKFFPASDVIELHRLGCRAFGESREQEASKKMAEVDAELELNSPASRIRWHMIGRIQRNKARAVAGWAHTAHAVDGAALAAALDRGAREALDDGRREAPLHCYVQLSLDGDAARGGVAVDDVSAVDELCGAVHDAGGLEFVGLMAIPPLDWTPEAAFTRLAAERDRVQALYQHRLGLSAGMSSDLEAAVRHGSTCVRVGTALLGQRPLTSP